MFYQVLFYSAYDCRKSWSYVTLSSDLNLLPNHINLF
jgi:hypothetical protein